MNTSSRIWLKIYLKIMTFIFKHPKYYKELRKRNKSDQVISNAEATAASERAPGQGQSTKPQAPSVKLSNQPVQATSDKPLSHKHRGQASSHKQQAQWSWNHGTWILEKF